MTPLFTRIDPHKNSTWHGRLTVRKLIHQGRAYSYDGTFAARSCGSS